MHRANGWTTLYASGRTGERVRIIQHGKDGRISIQAPTDGGWVKCMIVPLIAPLGKGQRADDKPWATVHAAYGSTQQEAQDNTGVPELF